MFFPLSYCRKFIQVAKQIQDLTHGILMLSSNFWLKFEGIIYLLPIGMWNVDVSPINMVNIYIWWSHSPGKLLVARHIDIKLTLESFGTLHRNLYGDKYGEGSLFYEGILWCFAMFVEIMFTTKFNTERATLCKEQVYLYHQVIFCHVSVAAASAADCNRHLVLNLCIFASA